jgi:hypothetical protein
LPSGVLICRDPRADRTLVVTERGAKVVVGLRHAAIIRARRP